MHVVLNLLRHVVVDDVLHALKVEALRGDVGGDQHVLLACGGGGARRMVRCRGGTRQGCE